MGREVKIRIGALIIVLLIFGAMGAYFLFIHNWNPSTQQIISNKVLLENGATDSGMGEVVWSNNQFAVDLYQELVKNNTENIVFSPFSIYLTLCMIYEGAEGTTESEMKEVLHLMDDDYERRGSFAKVLNNINSRDGQFNLKVANRLYSQQGLDINIEFEKIIEDRYFADIQNADFKSDPGTSIKEINDWVEEKTNGKIQDILQPGSIDFQTVLAFVNALYFSGDWETAFDQEDTQSRVFHTIENRTIRVPSMFIDPDDLKDETNFRGYFDNGIQAIELPYKGNEISMVLMTPAPEGNYHETPPPEQIFDFEKNISAEILEGMNNGFYDSEMGVMLPKFDFESKFSLKEKLIDLGMGEAFSMGADFSGISDQESMWLEDGVHQANIKIDEKGTEAAAATILWETAGGSALFKADRPFMFIIQDRETGLILFMGRIMDPSK